MSYSTIDSAEYKREQSQRQDQISKLPDEIIVYILSFMELKESVITGVLSRRWRYLWTNSADLNFDDYLVEVDRRSRQLLTDCAFLVFDDSIIDEKFLNCVNQALNSRRHDISINRFRVHFWLGKEYASDIDRWIKFAFSKRVKALDLHLDATYNLGSHNLIQHLTYEEGMRFLTTLHLSHLTITGGVLEFILSRCSLERLSISMLFGLTRLRIKDSSSKLKSLKIHSCVDLEELELEAEELACFENDGIRANIAYNYVPSLVEANFPEARFCSWRPSFWQFKCLSNQLVKLFLQLGKEYPDGLVLVGFPNLKYLELGVVATECRNNNLLAWMRLVEVCPFLLEFKLQVKWEGLAWQWEFNELELQIDEDEDIASEEPHTGTWHLCLDKANIVYDEGVYFDFDMKLAHWAKEGKHGPKNTLPNLSSFELVGFIGVENDVRLAMHIVEAAPMLSRICLDTTPSYYECSKHRRGTSKKRARKLAVGFPAAIDVKVL